MGGPADPGISMGPRNEGVRDIDGFHAGAAELGPCDDDVGTMIVGGPIVPGIS